MCLIDVDLVFAPVGSAVSADSLLFDFFFAVRFTRRVAMGKSILVIAACDRSSCRSGVLLLRVNTFLFTSSCLICFVGWRVALQHSCVLNNVFAGINCCCTAQCLSHSVREALLTPHSRKRTGGLTPNRPTSKMKMKIRRMKWKIRETVKSAKWRVEERSDPQAHDTWMT